MNAEIKPFFNGSEIAHLRATEAALVEDAKKTGTYPRWQLSGTRRKRKQFSVSAKLNCAKNKHTR